MKTQTSEEVEVLLEKGARHVAEAREAMAQVAASFNEAARHMESLSKILGKPRPTPIIEVKSEVVFES